MSADSKAPADCSGEFVWCVKLHEDKLTLIAEDAVQRKPDGSQERVNVYKVPGKVRPALVLSAVEGCRSLIVWYTCTRSNGIEVTKITKPRDKTKRVYLARHSDHIRRIPNSTVWCLDRIDRPDRTVFDAYLKEAQQLPFLRV
jgi:hypothetical protein